MTPREALEQRVIAICGLTDDVFESGFILPDGSLVKILRDEEGHKDHLVLARMIFPSDEKRLGFAIPNAVATLAKELMAVRVVMFDSPRREGNIEVFGRITPSQLATLQIIVREIDRLYADVNGYTATFNPAIWIDVVRWLRDHNGVE